MSLAQSSPMCLTRAFRCALVMVLLIGWPIVVHAQAPANKPDKPWYQGVSASDQATARSLFHEGAELHKRGQVAEAAEKYREALQHWDNPDIHFNLVQAYIELEKPLEAHASLAQATRYGLDFMTAKDRVRARDYQRLLEGHLVELTIKCDEPDAQLTLDDAALFTGPGSDTRWVLPGEHKVSARKDAYLDYEKELLLQPGVPVEVAVELISRALLATVEVRCEEPEAEVTLNGEPLMTCPAQTERELMSGESHAFAISRPGYLGEERTLTPKPGQRVEVALRTTTIELESRLRWQRWKPLSVVGVGLALGVVGGVLQNRAVSNMSAYDSRIDALCDEPLHGCLPDMVPDDVHALKADAERQNRMGVGLMLAGGAGIVAGLTLVYLNKPRATRTEKPSEPMRALIPTITKEGVGIATKIRF
jgi:tetratricopeptide (TPR) repeat protein